MRKYLVSGFCFLLIIFYCTPQHQAEPDTITVSILPQKYFVDRVTGGRYRVNVLVPPGASPATYEPTPQQIVALAGSPLYFRIGHIPFEKAWAGRLAAANPAMKIVDTSRGVDLFRGEHHHHEPDGEPDSETGIDPHIWLSTRAVKTQLGHIAAALAEFDPGNKEAYARNHAVFAAQIDSLDQEIKAILQATTRKKFMVFHPAWTYFAADYGLTQIPIEVEGKEPTPASLKKVIDIAEQEDIRVIFVQRQFDTHNARAVAGQIGAVVVQLDPLAQDWLDNMGKIAGAFKTALKGR